MPLLLTTRLETCIAEAEAEVKMAVAVKEAEVEAKRACEAAGVEREKAVFRAAYFRGQKRLAEGGRRLRGMAAEIEWQQEYRRWREGS